MTSLVFNFAGGEVWSRSIEVPDYNSGSYWEMFAIQRLPDEPIGTFVLTLTNLVVGSVIRIEVESTGALVELRTAGTSTEVFNVPAYVGGDPGNDLRIKVRKASAAPYYRPYETLATAAVGSASIYVSQIQDD